MMAFNHRVADLPPRERAMLDYAVKLTDHPHEVGAPDRQALRDAGLGDADIFDLNEVAAFFNYTNRVAQGRDMGPNAE